MFLLRPFGHISTVSIFHHNNEFRLDRKIFTVFIDTTIDVLTVVAIASRAIVDYLSLEHVFVYVCVCMYVYVRVSTTALSLQPVAKLNSICGLPKQLSDLCPKWTKWFFRTFTSPFNQISH